MESLAYRFRMGLYVAATALSASCGVAVAQTPALPPAAFKDATLTVSEGTWMNLDVSPDGQLIAFQLLGNIFTLPIAGGAARQMTAGPAYNENPQFSTDGRSIVYVSDRDGAARWWRMPLDPGAEPQPLSPVEAEKLATPLGVHEAGAKGVWDNAPVFVSRDGRYAVHHSRFGRDNTSGCRQDTELAYFILIDRLNSLSKRLAAAGRDCGAPNMPRSAFMPDNSAFVTAFGGKLWRIALPAGMPTAEGVATEIPFKAEVRLKLRPLRVFKQTLDESPRVYARRIEYPVLSPDGSRLAFSALHRLWVMSLPGGKPRRVTNFTAIESEPDWSPDGQSLLFTTWTDANGGEGHIYRVPMDKECSTAQGEKCAPQRLTTSSALYHKVAFSADGKRVFAEAHRLAAGESAATPEMVASKILSLPATGGQEQVFEETQRSRFALDVLDQTIGRLQSRAGHPEQLLRVTVSRDNLWPDVANAVEAMALTAAPGVQPASEIPVLKIQFPAVATTPAAYGDMDLLSIAARHPSFPDGYRSRDILLSPSGDRALLLFNSQDLYLLDVPPADADGVALFTFDTRLPRLRRVSWLGAGADFPAWQRDGRSFTFSFGNRLYVYDLAMAAAQPDYRPRALAVEVSVPRDLPTGLIAFRNARLLTLRGDEVIERGDLLVRDRRIAAVGPAGSVRIPAAARVVDLAGKTVMPGLFDVHNHVREVFSSATLHERLPALEANLAFGVLTSRDPQDDRRNFLTYEDLIAAGELVAPRYMNTGSGINVSTQDSIDSLQAARQVVARYADFYRAKYLKEYALERRDARQWLVVAAAERSLNVVSHGNGLKMLIADAVDGYGGFDHPVHPSPLYSDVRDLLAMSGIALGNQMNLGRDQRFFFGATLGAAELEKMRRYYEPQMYRRVLKWHEDELAQPTRYRTGQIEPTLNALVAAGGRVVTAGHGELPGLSTHLELWALVSGGMAPLEALRAATLRGAQTLGLDGDLGSLEAGKLAELVVLDRNPLDDIRNTLATRYVFFNGRLRDAATLEERR